MRSLALPYWSAVKPVPPSTVGQSQAIVWPWCGVSRNHPLPQTTAREKSLWARPSSIQLGHLVKTLTTPLGRLVHTTGVFASKHVRSLSVIDCYFIRYYFTGTGLLL